MRHSRRCVLGGLLCVVVGLSAGCSGTSSGGAPGRTGTVTGTSPSTAVASGEGTDARAQAEAFRRFFATDRDWLAHGLGGPNFGGRVYCAVDVLGRSSDARRAYLWLFCQELYLSGGEVQEGTGVSAPVLVTVSVSGSGAGTTVTSWRMPRDGAGYTADIRAMFPAAIAERAVAQDVRPSPSPEQLKALAARELRTAAAGSPASGSTP